MLKCVGFLFIIDFTVFLCYTISMENKEIICSELFDNALNKGVEQLIPIQSTFKTRNKDNYERFYELMLKSRPDIEDICNKRAKERTDDDIKKLKEFKKKTSFQYKQIKTLIFEDSNEISAGEEHTEKQIRITKLVEKIGNVVALMRYIGHYEIEDEFKKFGIELKFSNLEEIHDMFSNEYVEQDIKEIFNNSCKIQQDITNGINEIKVGIFENDVPHTLQYDANDNRSGLKPTDFMKLVKLAAKCQNAVDETSKNKAEAATSREAENNTFGIARLETIRAKVMELTPPVDNRPKIIIEDNGVK